LSSYRRSLAKHQFVLYQKDSQSGAEVCLFEVMLENNRVIRDTLDLMPIGATAVRPTAAPFDSESQQQ
jgi:hypothetical protein